MGYVGCCMGYSGYSMGYGLCWLQRGLWWLQYNGLAVVLAMLAAVYYHSESRFLNCSNLSEHGVHKDGPF